MLFYATMIFAAMPRFYIMPRGAMPAFAARRQRRYAGHGYLMPPPMLADAATLDTLSIRCC